MSQSVEGWHSEWVENDFNIEQNRAWEAPVVVPYASGSDQDIAQVPPEPDPYWAEMMA